MQYTNQILMAIERIVTTLDECRFRKMDAALNETNWETLVKLTGRKHAVLFVDFVWSYQRSVRAKTF